MVKAVILALENSSGIPQLIVVIAASRAESSVLKPTLANAQWKHLTR
jgi:hypothetical protein